MLRQSEPYCSGKSRLHKPRAGSFLLRLDKGRKDVALYIDNIRSIKW